MKTTLILLLCPLLLWGQESLSPEDIKSIKRCVANYGSSLLAPSFMPLIISEHQYKDIIFAIVRHVTFKNSDTLQKTTLVADVPTHIKKSYYAVGYWYADAKQYRKSKHEWQVKVNTIPDSYRYKNAPSHLELKYQDSTESAVERYFDYCYFSSRQEAVNSVAKFMELENRKPAPRKKPSALR